MLTSHPVSYCDVSSWAAHVHASSLILPPPPVVPSTSSTSTSTTVAGAYIYQDGCDRLLHFWADIPKPVCNVISRHLQLTIGNWDTNSLLESLPHPIRNPLVCSMLLQLRSSAIHMSYMQRLGRYPDVRTITDKYGNILYIRNLHWIQQVLLEMKMPARYLFSIFPPLYNQRVRIRMMIDGCEESMLYIQQWAAERGWRPDFKKVEMENQETNIFKLLEPYIRQPSEQCNTRFDVEY